MSRERRTSRTGRRRRTRAAAVACLVAACSSGDSGDGGGGDGGGIEGVALAEAFGGLSFDRPVKLVQHPSDDDRWYVVEQGGEIHTFLASDPAATDAIAVDVTDHVANLGGGNEQGLLSLAFSPDFGASGEVYLTYTDEAADESILARYVSDDGGLGFEPTADPVVLAIPHPVANHNAGDLAFGPNDGLLYYGMGDGGAGQNDNAQDPTTLLGAILRLDVTAAPPPGRAYAIPPTNPFAGNDPCDAGPGAAPCPEIWVYGLRNPWRMHFDEVTGALWLGDVGERTQEEIDVVPGGVGGANYGWACVEGEVPFEPGDCGFDLDGLEPPEAVHGRDEAGSITGGLVYRGSDLPQLAGHYVYGDFVTRRFFAFDLSDPGAPPVALDLPAVPVVAFGRDREGEVYVVALFGAPSIRRLVPAPPPAP